MGERPGVRDEIFEKAGGTASLLPGLAASILIGCIADYQSARGALKSRDADWQSAIQQVVNLRYGDLHGRS